MTLTRELRTTIAFTLAIFIALTAFVLGNQRQAHADSLAEDILCWIDTTDGIHPPVPFFFEEDCGSGPVVPPPPQCFDGIDNDNDGKTDWAPVGQGGDPGCDTPTDNDESDDPAPEPQCDDGVDNDSDGLVDMSDPGCSSPSDDDETNGGGGNPQCSDGVDNDSDGLVDFPADGGCSDAQDNNETNEGGGGNPACSDGVDNDSDGAIDFPADTGCTDAQDSDETNQGGGGDTPECSDGIDNDNDGDIDMEDPACDLPTDDDESNDPSGSGNGGSSHHKGGSSRSNNSNNGEVLGAEVCPMYLTGYIKQGAQNDAGEVAKLQVFLNNFEGNALPVTGTYGPQTLAAVNAFQAKYASEVLSPWGLQGSTGFVYYTTQKQINTIYCKFQKDFPLTAAQIEEIAYVRDIQPTLRAQGITSAGSVQGASVAKPATAAPAVGSVVLPSVQGDKNATTTTKVASGTAATTTKGWFGKFVDWLFGK